jgi:AraC-like DNA-binding protein
VAQFVRPSKPGGWRRAAVESIDDVRNAVLGAGLEATQLSRTPITGSLLFSSHDGVLLSSGLLDSWVGLRGPLSDRDLTVGFGLRLGVGSRHWLREVETGGVGVFRGGDEHDALYGPDSLYLAITLSAERLMREAERRETVIDERSLCHSGIHPAPLARNALGRLQYAFLALHHGRPPPGGFDLDEVIGAAVAHIGRPPAPTPGLAPIGRRERIVARARDYIAANLQQPINVDAVAQAAGSSRRTLTRAFAEVLGSSPQAYVLRLRLHRIRHDLASDDEAARSIASIANQWGVSELGRMSGRYRSIFGESPSETRIRGFGLTPAGKAAEKREARLENVALAQTA